MKRIILAGGCFWGIEAYYSRLKGILKTKVGYTDAEGKNPSYHDVCNSSGHVEAVYIEYDELVISLDKVLEHFFRIIDPTQKNSQGNDYGLQYRSAIFFFDEIDFAFIKEYLDKIKPKYIKEIQTYIKPVNAFYDAEENHQSYLKKNPTGYCHIKMHLAKPEELK
ncbi:MAG: peptide-methionine (S)-S-oxide reductase MsrA [Firmicutes bacterium]|nr:peptide-methionine (S)-S-oxide reductase MsrA [Bacillota bacterium]